MPTTIYESKVETGCGSVQITNNVPLKSSRAQTARQKIRKIILLREKCNFQKESSFTDPYKYPNKSTKKWLFILKYYLINVKRNLSLLLKSGLPNHRSVIHLYKGLHFKLYFLLQQTVRVSLEIGHKALAWPGIIVRHQPSCKSPM